MSHNLDPQPTIPARPVDARQVHDITPRERSARAVKLVAAYTGGLALAAVVLYGFTGSPDSRIERAWFNVHVVTDAVHGSSASSDSRFERVSGMDTVDSDPQNAGPIVRASSPRGAKYRSAWFNVH